MKASNRPSRRRIHLAILMGALVLLVSAERRLAYLDFNSAGVVRIENNEKPDGDEILNRLIFVADATEPRAPAIGDARQTALILLDSCLRALTTVRLSEPRAPPGVLPLSV